MNNMKKILLPSLLVILFLTQVQTAFSTSDDKPSPFDSAKYDWSKSMSLLVGFEGGAGWDSNVPSQLSAQAGVKLGTDIPFPGKDRKESFRSITLDLGYDRTSGRNGFSTEGSILLPVFRYPKPSADASRNFVRVYAEPGFGYKAGGGAFGEYGSAKVLAVLFSDNRLGLDKWSPFIEIQRRFPFNTPLSGDNRISIGIMLALCSHCGLD